MDDVLWVRNVARYPLWIGKERVLPGRVWSGERGFVMIALKRYPGRLVFVDAPSPPAPLPEEAERGDVPPSGDNPLLSAQALPLVSTGSTDGAAPVKRRRRKAAKTNE